MVESNPAERKYYPLQFKLKIGLEISALNWSSTPNTSMSSSPAIQVQFVFQSIEL